MAVYILHAPKQQTTQDVADCTDPLLKINESCTAVPGVHSFEAVLLNLVVNLLVVSGYLGTVCTQVYIPRYLGDTRTKFVVSRRSASGGGLPGREI